jgi:RNA polymerase sigma-70 factor, ECF subfamily
MALGEVDGETVVVILRDDLAEPTPFSFVRLDVAGGYIVRIADYIKCSWVLEAATSVTTSA